MWCGGVQYILGECELRSPSRVQFPLQYFWCFISQQPQCFWHFELVALALRNFGIHTIRAELVSGFREVTRRQAFSGRVFSGRL